MKKLIPALKEVFDYVIVDAAPLGQVVDCAVMAPELDGVLLVVDTTHNSYKLERRMKQQLEMSGAKILGVILNRVDFSDKGGYLAKLLCRIVGAEVAGAFLWLCDASVVFIDVTDNLLGNYRIHDVNAVVRQEF